jgi:UDP-glucose 4-epimerase
MHILITGAAGFIGSNLVLKCLANGHSVIGIDNFSYGFDRNIAQALQHPNFTFIKGDLTDTTVFKDLQADVIVHLASQKIPRYTNALRTLEENNAMVKNVLQACKKMQAKIVFASTSDVYGKNPDLPFTENSNLVLGSTQIKRWAYATSKIYSEQLIIAHNDEYGIPYCIVRFFGSYGPHQNLSWWGGPQSVFIDKALKNEEIEIHGDGMQTRTFTHVNDTVGALYHCVTSEKSNSEIFNIGTFPEEEISIVDLATLIWKLVNGEKATPKLRFISYESFGRYEDVTRRVPDISKLKQFFDFEPSVNLVDGLKRTIEWQRGILQST